MSLFWGALLVVAATCLAVAAMLLVRRRAPDGSFFNDGDRAAGVFGVLATGFSVLLGFLVFLAFTSYDNSRSGAEDEADVVRQQFETAQFFPAAFRARLGDELICYGRSVVHREWPLLRAGTRNDNINPWGLALFRTLRQVDPKTAAEQAAYGKWLDQTSDRQQARADRIHGADGVIPPMVWIVLFLTAGVIFVFMLFFADSGEPWFVQGLLMGAVVLVIGATLLVISSLNTPFRPGPGSLRPVAMERTLRLIDEARLVVGKRGPLPCDANGVPAA